jgi:hypothetical protein
MKTRKQQDINIDIIWCILLITATIAAPILMAVDVHADMITNTGTEMRVIFDKELTPEQLQLVKDIAKDQHTAAQKLTALDADRRLAEAKVEQDRRLAQTKVEQDSELARQVVFYAFVLVAVLIVVLLAMMRRQSRQQAAPVITYYHDAPVIEAQRVQALHEQRENMKLAHTQAITRREG